LAHFANNNEPYFLVCNVDMPSLELQRCIFLWIEDNFREDSNWPEKEHTWKEECDKEILGIDPLQVSHDDTYGDHLAAESSSTATSSQLRSSSIIDRIGFPKLLVRIRRVIHPLPKVHKARLESEQSTYGVAARYFRKRKQAGRLLGLQDQIVGNYGGAWTMLAPYQHKHTSSRIIHSRCRQR